MVLGTALHRGKDFAVSFQRRRWLALKKSLYPFGIKRFCSHLAPCGERALPATFLRAPLLQNDHASIQNLVVSLMRESVRGHVVKVVLGCVRTFLRAPLLKQYRGKRIEDTQNKNLFSCIRYYLKSGARRSPMPVQEILYHTPREVAKLKPTAQSPDSRLSRE